jgi:predicted TIM-barrel fold metal-dependent hydrolase
VSAIGDVNAWRLASPGTGGWQKSAQPGAPDKYLMVNTDSHANEPAQIFRDCIPSKYHDRLPRVEVDSDGNQWIHIEGWRPQLVKPVSAPLDGGEAANVAADSGNVWTDRLEPDDLHRMAVSSTQKPERRGLEIRKRDTQLDGVDAELVIPGRGLLAYATPDPEFSTVMATAWNRWAWETYGPDNDRFAPMAMIVPSDLDRAFQEIEYAKGQGFHGFLLPCRPVATEVPDRRAQYNSRQFDPLWDAFENAGLPVVFHVATGRDPRAASGNGGAVINLVMNSLAQVIEPLTYILASGVLERHPRLTIGTVEGGVAWLPWLLTALDHAILKHHMWSRPVLSEPPSTYYRRQCFSTFIEEEPLVLKLIEDLGLANNVMWSNDYPHQEGSWPHSREAIERQMQLVSEDARAAMLGLNAARVFGFALGHA